MLPRAGLHARSQLREAPQPNGCGASLGSGTLLFALACAVRRNEYCRERDEVERSYNAGD